MDKITRCSDNQTIAEYLYDYSGKRIVKKLFENGILNETIYSPTDEFESKVKADGTVENTSYIKVNDEIVARINPDGSKNGI